MFSFVNGDTLCHKGDTTFSNVDIVGSGGRTRQKGHDGMRALGLVGHNWILIAGWDSKGCVLRYPPAPVLIFVHTARVIPTTLMAALSGVLHQHSNKTMYGLYEFVRRHAGQKKQQLAMSVGP